MVRANTKTMKSSNVYKSNPIDDEYIDNPIDDVYLPGEQLPQKLHDKTLPEMPLCADCDEANPFHEHARRIN